MTNSHSESRKWNKSKPIYCHGSSGTSLIIKGSLVLSLWYLVQEIQFCIKFWMFLFILDQYITSPALFLHFSIP